MCRESRRPRPAEPEPHPRWRQGPGLSRAMPPARAPRGVTASPWTGQTQPPEGPGTRLRPAEGRGGRREFIKTERAAPASRLLLILLPEFKILFPFMWPTSGVASRWTQNPTCGQQEAPGSVRGQVWMPRGRAFGRGFRGPGRGWRPSAQRDVAGTEPQGHVGPACRSAAPGRDRGHISLRLCVFLAAKMRGKRGTQEWPGENLLDFDRPVRTQRCPPGPRHSGRPVVSGKGKRGCVRGPRLSPGREGRSGAREGGRAGGGAESWLSTRRSVPFPVRPLPLSVPSRLGAIVLYCPFGFSPMFLGSPICFEFSLNYRSSTSPVREIGDMQRTGE